MTISLSNELKAEISRASDAGLNGVEETLVEISLVSPENYLPECYPKYSNPACYCRHRSVTSVNGVTRDEDGDLGIDIVFGESITDPLSTFVGSISDSITQNLVELTIAKPANQVCMEDPIIPDQFGRIGPIFERDCPPDTEYASPEGQGPACSNPPLRPPGGDIPTS